MQGLPNEPGLQSTDSSKVKVKDGRILTKDMSEMEVLSEILITLQDIREILGG